MALLKVICWALIFIIQIRFPPGKSLATILHIQIGKNKMKNLFVNFSLNSQLNWTKI